jgi:hypothetical protein
MATSTRRAILAGAAGAGAVLLGGCTGRTPADRSSGPGPAAPATATASSGSPSTAPVVQPATGKLPATTAWMPAGSEVAPSVKLRAVRLLEAIGAWPAGHGGAAAARQRVAALGYDPALVASAAVLLDGSEAAAVQVVDVQYGGILTTSSSVLVVLRRWALSAGGVLVSGGTTVDVRLVASNPHWRVTAMYPAKPAAPAAHLPSSAAGLLAQPRLRLPVAARADLRSGTISPGTMAAMAALAREHVIDVSVIRSGHPLYVFGTNRLSDHPRGHAFDIWAVDGRTILDPANRALTEQVMRRGIELGAWQVGGPVDLDGAAHRYFSDNTHHDHVHMGFHG